MENTRTGYMYIDGLVQHYPKCLYFVKALRIVLHSPINMLLFVTKSNDVRKTDKFLALPDNPQVLKPS